MSNISSLSGWQTDALDAVRRGEDVMVVAPTTHGKTYFLDAIEGNCKGNCARFDGFDIESEGYDSLMDAYGSNSTVLIDEGGRLTQPQILSELLTESHTQTVIATLPACPPMKMVQHYFTVINGTEKPV